jgi:hypothetical protein
MGRKNMGTKMEEEKMVKEVIKHKDLMETDEKYKMEYVRLLFIHGELFQNIYRALHLRKDANFTIPPRYKQVTMEVVEFYNKWFSEKEKNNGKKQEYKKI